MADAVSLPRRSGERWPEGPEWGSILRRDAPKNLLEQST